MELGRLIESLNIQMVKVQAKQNLSSSSDPVTLSNNPSSYVKSCFLDKKNG